MLKNIDNKDEKIKYLKNIKHKIFKISKYVYLNAKTINQTPTLMIKPYKVLSKVIDQIEDVCTSVDIINLHTQAMNYIQDSTIDKNYKNRHIPVIVKRYYILIKPHFKLMRVHQFIKICRKIEHVISKYISNQFPSSSYYGYLKKLKANNQNIQTSSYSWKDVVNLDNDGMEITK